MSRIALALAVFASLIACKPIDTASGEAKQKYASQGGAVALEVPRPVQHFEAFCYRTGANYERVVDIAKLAKLDDVPERLTPVLGPLVGGGRAFIIENDKDAGTMVLLGVSDRNACSVFAGGFDEQAIRASVITNYNLKELMKDDAGLQITEMFVPNGVKATRDEVAVEGMLAVTRGKAEGTGISLSYISAGAAKQVFNSH